MSDVKVTENFLSVKQVERLLAVIELGQPFTVTFKKVSGARRVLLASMNESEHESRKGMLFFVWDREAMDVRCFRLDSVYSVSVP